MIRGCYGPHYGYGPHFGGGFYHRPAVVVAPGAFYTPYAPAWTPYGPYIATPMSRTAAGITAGAVIGGAVGAIGGPLGFVAGAGLGAIAGGVLAHI